MQMNTKSLKRALRGPEACVRLKGAEIAIASLDAVLVAARAPNKDDTPDNTEYWCRGMALWKAIKSYSGDTVQLEGADDGGILANGNHVPASPPCSYDVDRCLAMAGRLPTQYRSYLDLSMWKRLLPPKQDFEALFRPGNNMCCSWHEGGNRYMVIASNRYNGTDMDRDNTEMLRDELIPEYEALRKVADHDQDSVVDIVLRLMTFSQQAELKKIIEESLACKT